MVRRTVRALAVISIVGAIGAIGGVAAQTPKPTAHAQDENLPPISYTCPMHPDVLETKEGTCPICKMTLVPIRLDTIWTCPVHAAIHETKPGKCPIDHRDLIQQIVSVSWTCPGVDKDSVSPGICADGTPMTRKFAPRPHGNHNPQHGGQFFMASDNWHHLEGTYLPTGVFRLHLYDDYTKPLSLAQLRGISGSVVVKDPSSGQEKAIPLARTGRTLQGTIGKLPFPATMYAKVKFKPDTPDNRFDFTFDSYSKEPAPGSAPRITTAAPAPAASPTPTPAAPAAPSTDAASAAALSSGVDPALVPLPIPDSVPELLSQLRTRTDQIKSFIDRGSFASIYVPAFQAKDLALALDAKSHALPAEKQRTVGPAITKLVRSAWLLDAFGDIGNKQQISEAYAKFVEAEKDIQSAFPAQP